MTKVGRNAPCPCGSGKKYKHCCLPKEEHHLVSQSNQHDQFSQPDPYSPYGPSGFDPSLYPPPNLPESLDPRVRERDERIISKLAGREKFQTDEQYNAFLDYLSVSPVLPTAVPPETPLERAQDKMYDAFGAVGDRRVTLAKEALAISPDCADAYVLLAEETDEAEEALPLYEQGVAAAERVLGPDFRERYAGRFWTDLDTRPYLRARYGGADVLTHLGRREEAIAIARDLLELDPADEQGVTVFLINHLIIAGHDQEAAQLLKENRDEPGSGWRYNTALVKYRLLGDHIFARRDLLDAHATNPEVLAYLLGDKKPSKRPPKQIDRLIVEYDAILYTGIMTEVWQETPGLLDWSRRVVKTGHYLSPELAARQTGPRFHLNFWDDVDTRDCPDCDERTRKVTPFLAILIEPNLLIARKVNGRQCDACGLLTVHEWDTTEVAAAALEQFAPEHLGNPYLILGVIPDEAMRDREPGLIDTDWGFAQVEVFREHFEPEDDWDLDPGFDPAYDAPQDLLGPVMLLPPGRP